MYDIFRLTDRPEMKKVMAEWFHAKWGIPLEAYIESMDKCLECGGAYPQWYAAVEEGRMIAGMGVVENDFHDRKELSPNICAVYTDEEFRGRGIAGKLLEYVCADMHAAGIMIRSTKSTAGNFCAWCSPATGKRCRACMCTICDRDTKVIL